ncbi:uncharacterized protein JCM6883_003230 [Sporobolomyces salmoneus]|uniref:uncharacterized protein n=1 Tax=Sporobolomyces salmoneus TaxID=183962 RepID=UPI003175843A
MSGPSSPSAPGYLWVLSDPGDSATLEEFQDWYDNEHVPLRMQHIPEFLTGARYAASDSLTPGWSAAYDISSCALFSDPKYTKLRANRSPREGELVGRLGVLDRRTCETLGQTSEPIQAKEAAKFVVTIAGAKEKEGELEGMKEVEGWRRSSKHKVYDSLIIGHGKEAKSNVAPKCVIVHEFDSEAYVDTKEFEQAKEGKTEVRRWKLYKATANTASN